MAIDIAQISNEYMKRGFFDEFQPGQFSVLLYIARNANGCGTATLPNSVIMHKVGFTSQTVSKFIRQLADNKLIEILQPTYALRPWKIRVTVPSEWKPLEIVSVQKTEATDQPAKKPAYVPGSKCANCQKSIRRMDNDHERYAIPACLACYNAIYAQRMDRAAAAAAGPEQPHEEGKPQPATVPETPKIYETSDLGIAALLIMMEFSVLGIYFDQRDRGVFRFSDNGEAASNARKYMEHSLRIDPAAYSQALREAKMRIMSERSIALKATGHPNYTRLWP